MGPGGTTAAFPAWSGSRIAIGEGNSMVRSGSAGPVPRPRPPGPGRVELSEGGGGPPVQAQGPEVAEHHRRHPREAEQECTGHAEEVRHQDEVLRLPDP